MNIQSQFEQYLLTLDDKKKAEEYATDRSFAIMFVKPFLDWLDRHPAEPSVPTGKLSKEMWESFDHDGPIVGWVDAALVAKWVPHVEALEATSGTRTPTGS